MKKHLPADRLTATNESIVKRKKLSIRTLRRALKDCKGFTSFPCMFPTYFTLGFIRTSVFTSLVISMTHNCLPEWGGEMIQSPKVQSKYLRHHWERQFESWNAIRTANWTSQWPRVRSEFERNFRATYLGKTDRQCRDGLNEDGHDGFAAICWSLSRNYGNYNQPPHFRGRN